MRDVTNHEQTMVALIRDPELKGSLLLTPCELNGVSCTAIAMKIDDTRQVVAVLMTEEVFGMLKFPDDSSILGTSNEG